MRIRNLFTCLLIMAFVMTGTSIAQNGDKLPPVKITQYKLKNGLTVVLHQDRSTPVVAVNTWYHVGSKNEAAGRTGFAHLFEHMMFQGSKNYNNDYFSPLQEAGGSINGTTNQDRTWYYETVPANFLELAIFMEADRLGGLLEAMTQEKLDNQRDVVKNERRQRVDNVAYGTAFEKIGEIMYPKGHPYNWTTIGSLEDLQAASLEDVKGFFRQYYVPNNTILVLSGDFEEKQAKGWVEKYFGPIPAGTTEIARPNPDMPKLDKEIRTTVEDSLARFPRRYMVWHSVKQYASDEAALDILGSILSTGRTSRLQANLQYGKELVSQIGSGNGTNEIGGTFQIQATARPGKNLDDIEKEIIAELERIKKEPPTAEELARAKNSIESQTIFGLQTVLGKGSQIGNYAGYLKNPDWFQGDLDRYKNVTAADVQRVANQYLTANRLVMTYLPKQGEASRSNSAANQPTSGKPSKKADDTAAIDAQAAALPKSGPNPKLALPPIEKSKLSNGLEVWTVKQSKLPIVAMNMVFKTGATTEPKGKEGVANMAATLLDDGTKTRTADELANQQQSIGVNINANSGWDSTNVSVQTLTKNLDQALNLYADVIVNPSFPATEVESQRRRSMIGLQQQKTNPNIIGNIAYSKVLYGDHPYGRQLNGNEKTLPVVTRDDIVKYYEGTYRPNNGVLIVVGDVDKKTLIPKLETAFAGWKAGDVLTSTVPEAGKLDKTGIYLVDRPGSTQSVVSIGHVGIDRANPDYFPVVVMNTVLGGGITSRISMNLREDKGYTYGAGSGWSYRKGAGPFNAGGDMQTAVTKEAVWEVMKELTDIRGGRPITQKELDYNKQSLIRRYPGQFETIGAISGQLSNLVVYGLPDTYFNDYIGKINAVTIDDVNRVATKYLDPSKMAIVIVGDRKVIEGRLKELGYPVTFLDADGNPVSE